MASASSSSSYVIKVRSLIDFIFVARPESGAKEGEENKKLMFYHPKDAQIDHKVQTVGFAEAVFKFTESFEHSSSPADADPAPVSPTCDRADGLGRPTTSWTKEKEEYISYRHISTLKQLQVHVELEGGEFLFGLAIDRIRAAELNYTLHSPSLRNVLVTAYRMFKLFFGTFTDLFRLEQSTGAALKERLEYFLTRYLGTLRLHRLPLIDLFAGVELMPLDNTNFLKMETLIAQTLETFPEIQHILFLYQDRLLWHTVSKRDLGVLYRYLTQNLLPMSLRAELQPEMQPRGSGVHSHHHGKFITGPDLGTSGGRDSAFSSSLSTSVGSVNGRRSSLGGTSDSGRLHRDPTVPVVHLNTGEDARKLVAYNLIVYRALNATICMFTPMDESSELSPAADGSFYEKLDAFLGPELTAIASLIGDAYSWSPAPSPSAISVLSPINRTPKKELDFHYIYFNTNSLSIKTSFDDNSSPLDTVTRPSLLPIPSGVYRLACDLYDDMCCGSPLGDDVLVKADSEWWVSVRRTNCRFLFLLLCPRSGSLHDVNEEVKRYTRLNFSDVFIDE